MEDYLYDKGMTCPICSRAFTSKKARATKLKIKEKQDDLNVIYRDVNPLHYQIFVCPHCGFSATETEFHEVTMMEKRAFDQHIRYKWNPRDYGGLRSPEEVEVCYKLAILVAQTLNRSKLYLANLSIKLAWVYREFQNSKEEEYLRYALGYFQDSYQNQRLEGASIDEITIAYLVGELHRRFGDYREAILWYGKVLDNPLIKNNRQLQLKTREQWKVAKGQYDETKTVSQEG